MLERNRSTDGLFWTREILVLQNMPYEQQQELLGERIKKAHRVAIDSTGIGDETGERLTQIYGAHRVEPCKFTAPFKEKIFNRLKSQMEKSTVRIPDDPLIRKDLTSLQKQVTPGGTVRFVAAQTKDGHADRANALALAIYAARDTGRAITAEQARSIAMPKSPFHVPYVKF